MIPRHATVVDKGMRVDMGNYNTEGRALSIEHDDFYCLHSTNVHAAVTPPLTFGEDYYIHSIISTISTSSRPTLFFAHHLSSARLT